MMRSMQRSRYPNWFLLPTILIFGFLFVIPTLTSFYYSLTDWNINRRVISFIGLENFRELFSDVKFRSTLGNTLTYSFSVTFVRNFLGLFLAILLNNAQLKGRNLFRTIIFLPYVIAPVVIGYLFTAIYNPAQGILNQSLRAFGMGFLAQDWLNDPNIALFSTIMTDVWRTTGFSMVIYLAGLQAIPHELYESAEIDGANGRWKLTNVTIPLLAPSITINVVLALIGTMKVFVMILVLTNGGPGYATEVINTYIMSTFSLGLYGSGTAANIILSFLIIVIALPVLLFLKKREVEL
ncbi:carbohydrate ABC transporter membrane protein 1, CUT1 family [Sphaerochaeta associata]|nr:carbohydrate ABC transporter membrane protein 1, CUT1 family [Sphaerochaeta associata]